MAVPPLVRIVASPLSAATGFTAPQFTAPQFTAAAFIATVWVAALFTAMVLPGGVSKAEDGALVFEKDIQPIFRQKCGKCHGGGVRKGNLDLSTMSGLVRGGESEEPLVADSLADSYLWTLVADGSMPPEGEAKLTAQEVARIRQWLQQGAPSRNAVAEARQRLTQHDVLPILLLRCTACHGRAVKQGGLDLRTIAGLKRGGESGPAVQPGAPDKSLLIQRIRTEACPPQGSLLKFFVQRPPASETATLAEWIAAGAPEVDLAADVATAEPDPLVTEEDRQHWAFQPPQAVSGPASVDRFIQRRLAATGLDFAPQASRDTLIRRAYLDLIGMPPTVEQWRRWRAHASEDWYGELIEHLLASPHYGERWGRYWLDVAGYADSEGGVSADPIRPVAWKYRDYVIAAFNDDKPYDRFLLEQIAGDELVDYRGAAETTEEMVESLTATGFLRMGIDQTGSRTMNFVPERLGVINDVITVLGSGVMGLTLECARCHSHKYDPLPQRDYYRFKAIFQGALDEHDWLTFRTRRLELATVQQRRRFAERNPPLAARLKQLQTRQKGETRRLQLELLRHHHPELSEDQREATLAALRVADNSRTLPQRLLVEKLQTAEIAPDAEQPAAVRDARRQLEQLAREIAATETQMVPPLTIRALWDRGEPSPTYVLRRGEHDKPGLLVGPGVPSVLTDGTTPFEYVPPFPGAASTGRRLALARWLTRAEHPLTARVLVNRVWYHHFGKGLVATLENFGRKGERPTHPELLDWLAQEFVRGGWSVKQLHRLMMNSRTYRQSSRVDSERLAKDPANRLLSRMPLRRMDAEALRDSLLRVSGKLVDRPGGPPDRISVNREGLVSVDPTPSGGWRRSIYAQSRRTEIPTMLDTFDYPEMGPNCVARSVSNVSPQSLMLLNNDRVYQLAEGLAERARGTVGSAPERSGEAVDFVYQTALSRLPSDQERRLGIAALKQLRQAWLAASPSGQAASGQAANDFALVSYCHTILNSAAFIYVD